jgi:hypothetical protein
MALNVDLKVPSVNGFYDFVTRFYRAVIDLQKMPLIDQAVRANFGPHGVSRRPFARGAEGRHRGHVRRGDARQAREGPYPHAEARRRN